MISPDELIGGNLVRRIQDLANANTHSCSSCNVGTKPRDADWQESRPSRCVPNIATLGGSRRRRRQAGGGPLIWLAYNISTTIVISTVFIFVHCETVPESGHFLTSNTSGRLSVTVSNGASVCGGRSPALCWLAPKPRSDSVKRAIY
jgi:hypothetical protein